MGGGRWTAMAAEDGGGGARLTTSGSGARGLLAARSRCSVFNGLQRQVGSTENADRRVGEQPYLLPSCSKSMALTHRTDPAERQAQRLPVGARPRRRC